MRRMYLQMIGTPSPQGAGMDPAVATEAILQRMSSTPRPTRNSWRI